jgi:D-amino-acid dehydrogenase
VTRVCVIGAGIVGCATAYALARSGADVTLIDREPGPGRGTSLANGAQLSYSYVQPLASPQTLRALPAILLGRAAGLRFVPRLDVEQWAWALRFLWACRPGASDRGTARLLELAAASRATLDAWLTDERWDVAFARRGKLVLCPDGASLRAQQTQVDLQARLGCRQQVLSPAECLEREPALRLRQGPLAGGIWTDDECVVDPLRLSASMAAALPGLGGRFIARCEVQGLDLRGRRVVAARTRVGAIEADHFVMAAGPQARALAAALGIRLPIHPIKGYSLTLPLRGGAGPMVSVTDLGTKTVFAPLAGLLRVAAMAEIVGDDLTIPEQKVRRMLASVEQTYPGLCDVTNPQPWAGLRPVTPDSVPIVGRWQGSNLFLNVGHGALGLTLAAGCATGLAREILSTSVDGRTRPPGTTRALEQRSRCRTGVSALE